MFGWEFPPYNSGGLGIACYGLTKGLSECGANVTFVLPKKVNIKEDFLKVVYANDPILKVSHYVVNSTLKPYSTKESYIGCMNETKHAKIYGNSLIEEVERYAKMGGEIARQEEFDVIHAHDWLSMKAGVEAKRVSGKPLVVHIHATEIDRTAGSVNREVYDIERKGMQDADVIVTVSGWTKKKVVENYGISPDKIRVVHNAVDFSKDTASKVYRMKKKNKKVVLFVGRITVQKGPDYFVDAAKKVIDKRDDVVFIFSGSGDMQRAMIEKTAKLGISDKVLFAGFLRGKELEEAYKMSDVFVMPSVSEPFGLVPLESMSYNTPVIISRQSGVSEVISHCLKVDFWDIDEMANMILSVLRYPVLKETLSYNGAKEVKDLTWDKPAEKCISIYNELITNN